ncbi:tyrosine-type recombinase/integrase [Nocardia concava]|uniref:tyrosine-type recombinase/integrase n=1 Tax=Nocardia concava TaxID=257281 RepID=UPI00030DEB68|nr:tyrosine-type recombinase/integrase [Nocardia concava]
MEQRDGIWSETLEVTATSQADLIKRLAAVQRVLKKMDAAPKKARRARGEGTIFRRADGMVVGQIDLPRGPDGKRNKSKPIYSKDYAVVVKGLNKLKEDVANGIPQTDKRLTVETYLKDWIVNTAKPNLKPKAYGAYQSAIATRIIPSIGDRILSSLSTNDIRHMHAWILAATYTRGGEEVPYTTRSVEEAHNVLSAALRDALADQKVTRNVCKLVKKPGVISKSHGALTSEQARTVLLKALEAHDAMVTRWAAGLMLGGRQGELLGLEWDRVDLEKGVLDLAWQLEWLPLHKGADSEDPKRFDVPAAFEHRPLWKGAALTRPKSKLSQRMIPIPEPLAAILAVHKKNSEPNPWGLVWVAPPSKRYKGVKPVPDDEDRAGWAAAQARAGIAEPVDVHAMRGTTATLLMEAGVPDKIIQAIMGHSNVITTRGYQTVNLDAARKSLGNLHGLLELA